MNKISLAIGVAALLMYGCSDSQKEQESTAAKTEKTEPAKKPVVAENIYGTSAAQPAQEKAPEGTNVQGSMQHTAKVLETANAAGYTYVKVDEGGNIYWVAGPTADIKVGSSVSYIEQMVMQEFTSKALNRTFDQLMFASTLIPEGKSSGTSSHAKKDHDCDSCGPDDMAASAPANGSKQKPVQPTEKISIAKVAGNYTVEELHTKKASLKDKIVKVNAKVVKVSKNIMKKDWIHLQDGSGSGTTSDIVVTATNSTVNVGDIVTTEAVLNLDVDFGYGYFFPVILQEAKFTVSQK